MQSTINKTVAFFIVFFFFFFLKEEEKREEKGYVLVKGASRGAYMGFVVQENPRFLINLQQLPPQFDRQR